MKWNIRRDGSVKWKIFGSLLVFIAIIIFVLWLFQVFLLENFYVYIKGRSVKEAASEINKVIYNVDYEDKIDEIIRKNEFCVTVYDSNYEATVYSSGGNGDRRCGISNFDIESNVDRIRSLQKQALLNNGTASELFNNNSSAESPLNKHFELTNGKDVIFDFNQSKELSNSFNDRRTQQSVTYVSVVVGNDLTMKTIIVNSQLTPVNATIETIKVQFVIIAIILVLVALLLALYLSKKIARPIIKINDSAKLLATGQYDVEFKGEGYLEIDELGSTLSYAAKELSKVEKLRRELIANMSHDLRTPLTMISGYSEVMRDIPGENTAENVQIIIDETKRLTNLVNDMLDLSKLQAGALELNSSTFNLTLEIQGIIERYDKLLTSKDFTIDFENQEDVNIEADNIKINQVIYNLINNAINYCGDDHKVIVKQKIVNDIVTIEIIDHGPGIEKEQIPYIWERYYKIDKTHVRSKIGSGLGLSIVRSVLELHQAKYGVKSVVGSGTIFWFSLPIKK